MIIYLIRHGQTTGDVENRFGGDYDDHLTELGQQQSMNLAKQLKDKNIEQLYSSPRLRALETATTLAEKLKLDIKPLDDFRERNSYGVLTGLTRQEAAQKYPEEVAKLEGLNTNVQQSEDYKSFQERILASLNSLSQQPAKTVAVVMHGGPIRMIFREVLKLGEINLGDCAYAVLETNGQNYSLKDKNGIDLIS